MIKLYQLPRVDVEGWNVPNASPACLKLETWLRMTGIPYEVGAWPAPVDAPKGKWPYIDDSGLVLGDSTLIVEHLRRTRGVDPDKDLTAAERAIGLAFRRMLKENLYWLIIQIRWRDEPGWQYYRKSVVGPWFGGDAPEAVKVQEGVRTSLLDQMTKHGIGRHSAEEVHQICSQELIAVSDYLGDKPFFFGDKPTGADATLYAYVTNVIDVPMDSPSTRIARERSNLVDYCRRMRERFFS